MNGTAEGQGGDANQERSPPASSSPPSSPSCNSTQIWLPAGSPLRPSWMNAQQMEQDGDSRQRRRYVEMQASPPPCFYEELFCTSHASGTLVPLSGALVTSSGPPSDVVKQGYLAKLERSHRRYFVLRAGSHTGPSRLEWYKSQEKFAAMEKSAGKAALFGSSKQGVIYLRCCLGVSRSGSSRKGHTVVLYAKNQTVVLMVEDQWEQEEWYLAIKKLMEEERKDEEHGEGFEEEDDGYCTLPPAAFYKEVWPVTVKARGLGCSKSLAGESRLCLTATALTLVRVAACGDLPSVTMPLLSVRRFGHLDGSFFLELGRSAPTGPGEIWMEARDQGNAAGAQHIHEVVRETVRALRALPDFSRSPTSNHNQLQTLLASKRCRPKYRDKPLNARPLGSRLAPPPRNPESPTRCHLEPHKPQRTEANQSSASEAGSYMEMIPDHHLPVDKGRENDCRGAATATGDHCRMEGWEQGPGYMMMSSKVRHSSPVLPHGDYVTMTSPQKHNWPAYSSPSSSSQTSSNSSPADGYSPLHPSHHQANEHRRPRWLATSPPQSETEAGQSQLRISCSARPQEETSAKQRRLPAETRATPSPVRGVDGSVVMTPFVLSGPVCTRPVQASPISGSCHAASDQSVRRCRLSLSLCLPSCLQPEERQ